MEKGFTLIELLIVIAVLAVLSAVVVLILNPTELLRESRDGTRFSDLETLNKTLSLYVTDTAAAGWIATTTCTAGTTAPTGGSCRTSTSTATNGTGWVPLNLSLISAGSPLSRLPIDPLNTTSSANQGCSGTVPGCFYAFSASTTPGRYKFFTRMESLKYQSKEWTEGGTLPDWFEVGSDLQSL